MRLEPQQGVCYKVGNETGDWVWRRGGSEDLKIACLLCWPACFSGKLGWQIPRKSLLECVLGQLGKRGRSLEGIYAVCWRWEREGSSERGLSQSWSDMGHWTWRRRREVETYSWPICFTACAVPDTVTLEPRPAWKFLCNSELVERIAILLPQHVECWDYRYVSPCQA